MVNQPVCSSFFRCVWVLVALLTAACASPRSDSPSIREIYRKEAKRETRNPVIVIPGILGSRLIERESGKIVWGAFTSDAIDLDSPEGIRALAVPLPDENAAANYDPKTAPVFPDGPVEAIDVDFLFGVITVDVYSQILRSLGVGHFTDPVSYAPEYAEDHYSCFTFFYDWRRDNVENAMAFGDFLSATRKRINRSTREKIEALSESGEAEDQREARELQEWLDEGYRFDVVAHSMGGLIARYFLRYGTQDLSPEGGPRPVTWAGAEEIDRLIMVATPNLGSMNALKELIEGFAPSIFLPDYHQGILGTMPAIYQLLPRQENAVIRLEDGTPQDLDFFDVDQWDRNGWGLMDPESDSILAQLMPTIGDPRERRRRAKNYIAGCLDRAQRFHRALDSTPQKPSPADIRLFAGDTVNTLSFATVERSGDKKSSIRFDGGENEALGDGTVARYSAIGNLDFGDDRSATWLRSPVPWNGVTFFPDDHLGLTSNPQFTDNLLFQLLSQAPPRRPDSSQGTRR